MATSDCVHTYHLHFQGRDGKDQRKKVNVDVTCEWAFITLGRFLE